MRTRLVIWGTNAENEKLLLAIALLPDENKVDIFSFPEKDVTEDFYNILNNQWREGKDIEFPVTPIHYVTDLTASESVLPENLKVERTDVINRAQTEWHFVVLSSKLYKNFKNDLEDFTDKIKRSEFFDQKLWDDLKGLWSTIQTQIFDKNLFKDHGDSLKNKTNVLFDELKGLRKSLDEEFHKKSRDVAEGFFQRLQEIEEKIVKGMVLKPLFEELRKLQDEFKNVKMTASDREQTFKKIDVAFKTIKEKRGNRPNQGAGHPQMNNDRINSRLSGLMEAIQKMEKSIERDQNDLIYENKRIEASSGQLEAQIRQAKLKMIEERLRSKKEKLEEMRKTQDMLDKKIEKEKKREEKREEKVKETQLVNEEADRLKAKLTEEIHQKKEQLDQEMGEKLGKAAEEIKASKMKRKPKAEEPQTNVNSVQMGNEAKDQGEIMKEEE